jgi:hypothetical protein
MAEDFFDPLGDMGKEDISKGRPSGDRQKTNFVFIGLAVLAVLVFVGVVFYSMTGSGSNSKTTTPQRDIGASELKLKTVQFLNHFLNLSYNTFAKERELSESFMLPEYKSTYKEKFYVTEFTDKVIKSGLAVNYRYSEIIPDVYKQADGTVFPEVRVIGLAKYTSVRKNVSVEMPFTIGVVWELDENKLWKVSDVLVY